MSGPSSFGAHVNIWKSRGMTLPNWSSAFGCNIGLVMSLIDLSLSLRSARTNQRSNIARNVLVLGGMAAMGETFSCSEGLSFISSHLTIRACPCATFSSVSSRSCAAASGTWADGCAAYLIAANICSTIQVGPQSTGHPLVPNSKIIGAARCPSAGPDGYIRP